MFNKLIRLAWFLSSYAPLWIIFSINNLLFDERCKRIIGIGPLTYLFLGLAIFPCICVFLYLGFYRKANGNQKVEVVNPKIISDLSREYIVTYAISLIGFNLLDIRQAISFCFLIVFFAYLYIKYDTVAYNPMLELLNYRMFNADIVQLGLPQKPDGSYLVRKEVTIITKKKASQLTDDSVYILPMNAEGDLFIEAKKKH